MVYVHYFSIWRRRVVFARRSDLRVLSIYANVKGLKINSNILHYIDEKVSFLGSLWLGIHF
jgi:hypothetical protein